MTTFVASTVPPLTSSEPVPASPTSSVFFTWSEPPLTTERVAAPSPPMRTSQPLAPAASIVAAPLVPPSPRMNALSSSVGRPGDAQVAAVDHVPLAARQTF